MKMNNAFDPAAAATALDPADRALLERRRVLGPAYRLFYERPVHVVRAAGVWLYGPDGEAYLDAYNNVAAVGHCHPHVVEALARQAAVLNTHTRYLGREVLDYAERLVARFPAPLANVMFTCTGSEANDLALRIARAHTGGLGMIVTETAYHGVTAAVAELSPSLGGAASLAPTVRTVPAPDAQAAGGDPGPRFAAAVADAIADLQRCGIAPCALLVDTVFSSDGVFAAPAGFLRPAVEAVRAAGGLFIADEVQAGFARTGDAWWGFERHGLVPDLVTLGKPMGNGHPLAGVVARPGLLEAFGTHMRYFNTFGGNAVSCAVGQAVLDVIERERLLENAQAVGRHLRERLEALCARHALVGEVRGAGLFVGVELVRDRTTREPATSEAARVVNALRERRVLVSSTGPRGNVLKIRPPLVFSRENADLLVECLDASLAAA